MEVVRDKPGYIFTPCISLQDVNCEILTIHILCKEWQSVCLDVECC